MQNLRVRKVTTTNSLRRREDSIIKIRAEIKQTENSQCRGSTKVKVVSLTVQVK